MYVYMYIDNMVKKPGWCSPYFYKKKKKRKKETGKKYFCFPHIPITSAKHEAIEVSQQTSREEICSPE